MTLAKLLPDLAGILQTYPKIKFVFFFGTLHYTALNLMDILFVADAMGRKGWGRFLQKNDDFVLKLGLTKVNFVALLKNKPSLDNFIAKVK